MFDIFGNGKAWARDLGECAHTNEAKLYGLRFRRQLRGDCFQGNSPATDVRQNFGSCGLAATEREFRPNVLRQMMAARGIIADARSGKNGRHALAGLFRQSVFSRLVGYEDVNDAERLRHDPAMRWIVGGKAAQRSAASPSQMGRFETQWLAAPKNFAALAHLSGQWIDLVHGRRPPRGIVLDMDSSVSPTHGEQEMSVWNGHYACTCYHPLFR